MNSNLLWAAFVAVIKASTDDPSGHLPNCGYTYEAPTCGCAAWGERVHEALKSVLADWERAQDGAR